jgi:hypothetical protein
MASDGAGHVLVSAHRTSLQSMDLFVLDATGHELWSENLRGNSGRIFAWSSTAPWLWLAEPSPAGHYAAVPSGWYGGVMRGDSGFTLVAGTRGWEPVSVAAIRAGEVTAQGALGGTQSQDGVAAFPFLAGEEGDHLLLVAQQWHANAGLCYPTVPGAAALWRFDTTSAYQCPFEFDSPIDTAALLDGRLVLGRRTYYNTACFSKVPPTTIEAYGVPGESLSPSGWVQWGGSPGLGMRPRNR